jgi:hypothetical protein
MYESSSLAVWCQPKVMGTGTALEVHVNYWRVENRPWYSTESNFRRRDFIEIGLMLTSPSHISSIGIFLPGNSTISDISDVGTKLSNQEISHGIFNKPLTSTHIPGTAMAAAHVRLVESGVPFCRVHEFILANGTISPSQLSLTTMGKGVVLRIKDDALTEACRGLPAGEKVYFRLRIEIGDKTGSSMLQRIRVADKGLQSGYSQIEYLDFRLNEVRTLPPSVAGLMRMENASDSNIELIAFLAAVPVEADILSYKTAASKSRLLEHQIWNSYIGGNLPQGMVVYHWKKEALGASIEDFSTFLKLQTRKSNWITIIIYLGIALAFGLAGNIGASYIQKRFEAAEPTPTPVVIRLAPGSRMGKAVVVTTSKNEGRDR